MLDESGHLNPTFKLARALVAAGHDVRYLAVPDVRRQIEAQGFPVELLFSDLFPEGTSEADQALSMLDRRRAITLRYRALLKRLLVSAPAALASRRPDLMLVDVTQAPFAFWARRHAIPFSHLNTSLPQTKDSSLPPLRSPMSYGAGRIERLRAEFAWRGFLAKRRLGARLASAVGMCPPYQIARDVARRFVVDARELDVRTVYMPQLRNVPELVLCPEAFDFPRPARPERCYVESIDLARVEHAFDWSALAPGKPLLYCAFGRCRYRERDVQRLFSRLSWVLRERPGWQLLLSVGQHVSAPALRDLPPNVLVAESVPQLAVLPRARAMITHAGLGSVKECIMHGVPMLALPLDVDQPGNAARIAHHGLGLQADIARIDECELLGKLDRLMQEDTFRLNSERMKARFERAEALGRGVECVTKALDGRYAIAAQATSPYVPLSWQRALRGAR